jgi:hypothetical protein
MTVVSAAGFASQAYAALLPPAAGRAPSETGTGRVASLMDTDTRDSSRRIDFSHATPQQMQAAAAQLFSSGRINLTELGLLQQIGLPPARLDADGARLPPDAAERAQQQATPLDYHAAVADRIAQLQQADTVAPSYGNWLHLQSVLQGSAAPGADYRA